MKYISNWEEESMAFKTFLFVSWVLFAIKISSNAVRRDYAIFNLLSTLVPNFP